MSQQMFTSSVGSQSMNTMLITPAAQNTDATAFQLTGILYNLWLSMKMDISNALKLILSKIVNPCLTISPHNFTSQCHHGFRGPICSSFQWLKKCKSTSKHQFLWTSITYLGTHHALTHCCIQLYKGNVGYSFHKSLKCNGKIINCVLMVFQKHFHHLCCVIC